VIRALIREADGAGIVAKIYVIARFFENCSETSLSLSEGIVSLGALLLFVTTHLVEVVEAQEEVEHRGHDDWCADHGIEDRDEGREAGERTIGDGEDQDAEH
jgi:hypothetical protein